jgi:hypothetical protein
MTMHWLIRFDRQNQTSPESLSTTCYPSRKIKVTAALNTNRKKGRKIQRGTPRSLTFKEIHRCPDPISSGRERGLVLDPSPGYECPSPYLTIRGDCSGEGS